MSRWIDSYKTHPFHTDWANLEQVLSHSPTGGLPEVEEFARLRKIAAYIGVLIENVDPELANPNLLGNLLGQVQAVTGEVSTYFANGDISHLRNANSSADGMIAVLMQTAIAPVGSAKGTLTKATIAYQETLERYTAEYGERMRLLTEASETRFSNMGQKLDGANEGVSKLDARIAAMEAQLPTQLSSYNTTFQASEAQRTEKFDKSIAAHEEKVNAEFIAASAKAGKVVSVLLDFEDQAAKVLGTVVDTAQAGAYATYASEEKKSANLYRRLAIFMMISAALVLFLPEVAHAVREAAGYNVDWQKALARLPFSLVLFAPALYLAKESSRHRTNEVSNRRRQHILTTIGPYLALLPPDKAQEIKAEVAKSIFSDTAALSDDKATNDTGNLLAQLANLVAMKVRS